MNQELAAEIGPGFRRPKIGDVGKPSFLGTIRYPDQAPIRAWPESRKLRCKSGIDSIKIDTKTAFPIGILVGFLV